MIKAIEFALLAAGAISTSSGYARADSGYRVFPLADTTTSVQFTATPENVICSEVDFWGQSTVKLLGVNLAAYAPLASANLTRLFDEDCKPFRDELIAKSQAGQGLSANLVVKIDELVEWGVYDDGTRHATPYCRRTLRQFAYLVADPLFPVFEYQASASYRLSPLSYQECVRLWAQ
jgi:hypothetical protein